MTKMWFWILLIILGLSLLAWLGSGLLSDWDKERDDPDLREAQQTHYDDPEGKELLQNEKFPEVQVVVDPIPILRIPDPNKVTYILTFRTRRIPRPKFMGHTPEPLDKTKSKLKVTLIGDKGQTREMTLEYPGHELHRIYEMEQRVQTKYIGKIQKIHLVPTGLSPGQSRFLSWVRVENTETGNVKSFGCQCWLFRPITLVK